MSHGSEMTAGHDHGAVHLPHPPGRLGITRGVLFFVFIVIVISTIQGAFVIAAAPWGRVWPAADSAKIQLPPMNLGS
jgi:hypothetical protein